MRKYSTLGLYAQRMLCACILSALVLFSNNVFSQGCPSACGASPWGEAYGVQTPIANNAQNLTVGSGTYTVFSTLRGGTYTFSTCGGSWADSYISGFPIGSSACLFYNDDNGPACAGTKASQTYSPSVDNLINVQINRKVSGSCQGWVSGGTSGTLTYRCAPPAAPAPTTFGNAQWNVYVWNAGEADGTNAWGANAASYSGYLTDGSLSFNSSNHWVSTGSPSDAPSYLGCYVGVDNHSWAAKRTNFTCGIYTISIPTHDDACQLYVNGNLVLNHVACCDAHPNVWTGLLNSASTVEFRVSEGAGGSGGEISVTPVSTGTLTAGTVGSSQTICTGGDPAAFTSNSLATGGAGSGYLGGSYTYDWGYQDNCTGAGVAGIATGTTYDAPAGLTNTRCYYRRVIDGCGNDISTAPITITVVADPTPNTPTLTNATICVGGASNANITFTGGTGSPTYTWQYFNGSTWNTVANGAPAGAVYTGSTTANLSISGITAAGVYQYRAQVGATGSGCGTTASSSVSLTVVADPSLSAPAVSTATICTGGTSNISSSVSGGTGTTTYQWQYDNGGTWVPVANGLPTGAVYVNANTATLTVSAISVPGTYNYRNSVVSTGDGCNTAFSSTGTITVVADPAAAAPTFTNPSVCTSGSTQVSSVVSGGTGTLGYQWQYFNGTWASVVNGTPAGAVYTNQNTATMTISGIVPLGSYQYRLVYTASGSDCNTATSTAGTLVVSAGPSVTAPL
ncbi:MAG: hypothetical protein JST49_09875, partial [Bacteroidetes bacterium]|nr:hypothetical protein [Bacteroidota bacterium]